MNKNITAIILIVLAVAAVWWGWGKLQPYIATAGDAPVESSPGPMEGAMPPGGTPVPQP